MTAKELTAPIATAALPIPPGFSFLRTALSHGWFDLPPFRWDAKQRALTRVLSLECNRTVEVTLRAASRGRLVLTIGGAGPVSDADRREVLRQARWMLRLDEDLASFHAIARGIAQPDLRWVERTGAGRLLRSPSVFEDLVRMICTTNCGWPLTRVMIGALVARLGTPGPSGDRAFPTPEAMAGRPVAFYRDTVRAGYRAAALRELARRVASGNLGPSRWADPSLPDAAVREEILSVPGAGQYVADNVMKLLGRYSGLGLDAWCRRVFSERYCRGRKVTDARIERFYEPFGAFRGLALWCDVTRDWFDHRGKARLPI